MTARPAAAIRAVLDAHPPQDFEPGEVLIESILIQTADLSPEGIARGRGGADPAARVGFVVEGLVRGMWNRSPIAPTNRATITVSGDGKWIGADTFKYGKNMFQYTALAPTRACVLPLSWIREAAPREVLVDFLRCVSLDWCTTASVASLGGETLARRALLLLYNMSRLHPRPELEVRQKDVADMLGVSRQALHPILKRYEALGLIGLGYAEILVTDPKALITFLRRKGRPRRS